MITLVAGRHSSSPLATYRHSSLGTISGGPAPHVPPVSHYPQRMGVSWILPKKHSRASISRLGSFTRSSLDARVLLPCTTPPRSPVFGTAPSLCFELKFSTNSPRAHASPAPDQRARLTNTTGTEWRCWQSSFSEETCRFIGSGLVWMG